MTFFLSLFYLCLNFVLGLAWAQLEFTLDPSSFVQYEAADERETFSGRASLASVTLRFDSADTAALEVVLEPAQFDSGNFIRDTNARRTVFDTSEYPEIRFSANVSGAGDPGVTGDLSVTGNLSVTGDLNMHGVTRRVRLPVSVEREGSTLRATSSFSVLLSDYDMSRPRFLSWEVEDEVKVHVEIVGRLE